MDSAEDFNFESLQRRLPENSVAYSIFLDDNQNNHQTASRLQLIEKEAQRFVQDLTKNYIWQREDFNLDIRSDSGK